MAVTAAPASPQPAPGDGHDETQAAPAHAHSDVGVVPMPGQHPLAASTPSTAAGMAHAGSDSAADMAGMSAEGMAGMAGTAPVDPPVAPSPTSQSTDPMAGMSDEDMAAMGHTADAHTSAAGEGGSGRPLGATLAGFGLINVAVLVGALVIGRRRARQHRSGRPQGITPSRKTAAAGTGAAQGASTLAGSTESAGSLT